MVKKSQNIDIILKTFLLFKLFLSLLPYDSSVMTFFFDQLHPPRMARHTISQRRTLRTRRHRRTRKPFPRRIFPTTLPVLQRIQLHHRRKRPQRRRSRSRSRDARQDFREPPRRQQRQRSLLHPERDSALHVPGVAHRLLRN